MCTTPGRAIFQHSGHNNWQLPTQPKINFIILYFEHYFPHVFLIGIVANVRSPSWWAWGYTPEDTLTGWLLTVVTSANIVKEFCDAIGALKIQRALYFVQPDMVYKEQTEPIHKSIWNGNVVQSSVVSLYRVHKGKVQAISFIVEGMRFTASWQCHSFRTR